jgi:OOP family OmpA-OmpF porin
VKAAVIAVAALLAAPGEIVDLDPHVVDLEGEVVDLTQEVVTFEGDRDVLTVEEQPERVEVRLAADVFFAFGDAALTPDAIRLLDGLAVRLRVEAAAPIVIEGHTDAIDDDAFNQVLSERRAEAVRAHLAGPGGLGDLPFEVRGYGETQPLAANENEDGSDNPQGRALNRRVTIRYLPIGPR